MVISKLILNEDCFLKLTRGLLTFFVNKPKKNIAIILNDYSLVFNINVLN